MNFEQIRNRISFKRCIILGILTGSFAIMKPEYKNFESATIMQMWIAGMIGGTIGTVVNVAIGGKTPRA